MDESDNDWTVSCRTAKHSDFRGFSYIKTTIRQIWNLVKYLIIAEWYQPHPWGIGWSMPTLTRYREKQSEKEEY